MVFERINPRSKFKPIIFTELNIVNPHDPEHNNMWISTPYEFQSKDKIKLIWRVL